MRKTIFSLILLFAAVSPSLANDGINVDSLLATGTWAVTFNELTTEKKDLPYVTFSDLNPELNFLIIEGDSIATLQRIPSTGRVSKVMERNKSVKVKIEDFGLYQQNGLGGLTWRMKITKMEKTVSKKGKVSLKIYNDFFRNPIFVDFNKDGTVANISLPDVMSCSGVLQEYVPGMCDIGSPLLR